LVPEIAKLFVHGFAVDWVEDSSDNDVSDLAFCMDANDVDGSLEGHNVVVMGGGFLGEM
jgi:hypothetical protein